LFANTFFDEGFVTRGFLVGIFGPQEQALMLGAILINDPKRDPQ
jgi:hypothetical protein